MSTDPDRTAADHELTLDGMRTAIADVIGIEPSSVGAEDELLRLGLDSIGVMRLASRWQIAGADIKFADLIELSNLAEWWALVSSRLMLHPASRTGSAPADGDERGPFGLGMMQYAYWVGRRADQFLGAVGSHFYNEFDGADVEPRRLEKAIRAVADRHPMLRARFLDDGRQQILPRSPWRRLTSHDLRGLAGDAVSGRLAVLRDELSHRSLDAAHGEVFDVQLSRLPGGRSRIHVIIEMLVADAESYRILLDDLAALYLHPEQKLPAIGYSFRRYLEDKVKCHGDYARDKEYWQRRIADIPARPPVPLVPAPERARHPRFAARSHWLGPDYKTTLGAKSRQHSVTPAVALLAAFAEVVGAWSNESRFILNVPFYNREPLHPDVGKVVGDYTDLIILAVDLTGPRPFGEVVRRLQKRLREDAAHSGYSGVDVLRDIGRAHPERPPGAPVVFTSALSLGEMFSAEVRNCFGSPGYTSSQMPQVWLDHQVTDRGGGLFLNWDAVEELFPAGVLDEMFGAYLRLLDWLADGDWDEPVGSLLPASQARVRARVNAVPRPRSGRLLHEAFFGWAERGPGRVALAWGEDGRLSYGRLAGWALRLASVLVARGVRPGDLVAVTASKGPAQVAAVLGVLAAGGVYVPVGVDQPVARRASVYADAGVRLVLAGEADLAVLEWPDRVDVLAVEDAADAGVAPLAAPVAVGPEQLAYVIYTSGSTGAPKGVMVSHRSAVNTVEDVNERFGVGADDRVLGISALDFDLSVYDIFGLLGAGGAVVLVGEGDRRDARCWAGLVRRWGVTVWNSVPSLLDMLLVAAGNAGPGGTLRLALVSGDWVGLDLPGRLASACQGCRLVALGGATEAAIWSNAFEVTGEVPGHWRSIPYGYPLGNQMFRVVDAWGRDCPDWVPGELWIGGEGVALGYWGDPERTSSRFISGDQRWYRTGDQGRYWPDGTLEFLGRADLQVKVRGHRIELGEIEAALQSHPGVARAVAIVTDGGGQRPGPPSAGAVRTGPGPQLAAVVVGHVPGADLELPALEQFLAGRLPGYMLPQQVVAVAELPLSANGKLDRKAVAGLLARADHAGVPPGLPPQGETEQAIAAIWTELLGLAAIDRDQSFFALGGDSLLATRLIETMQNAGLVGGDLGRLFAAPKLKDFAASVTLGQSSAARPGVVADPDHRHEPFPATDVQRAYWMGRSSDFGLGGVGSHLYWEFDCADLDVTRLENAWNALIIRHEMLRTVFCPNGQQRILAETPWYAISVIDIAESDTESALTELRESLSCRVPDPVRWPLIEVRAARYGHDRTRIAFSFDYIVVDAFSIITLLDELGTLYCSADAILPEIAVSFRDYLLCAKPEAARLASDQQYWLELLDDLPPAPQLPLATDPSREAAPRFTRRDAWLPPDRWQVIADRARGRDLTPAAVLAAAFATVLSAWSSRPDLTLNLTLFQRSSVHPDIEKVLGDFTSLLLVPFRPTITDSWAECARDFQQQLWSNMGHSSVSAIWVMREMARRAGEAVVTMPVVFTSALGLSDELVNQEIPFGEQIWGISQTPQVWLDHQVTDRGGGLFLNWDAVEELFPAGVLDEMFGAYLRLLDWLADGDWDEPVGSLLPASQARVRARVNAVPRPRSGRLLHEAFFGWAERGPGRVALAWGEDGRLSYGRLAGWALRLASVLVARGVRPGDLVAVTASKGPAQVAAVLGVLAAGGVYVPVGVDQPVARRASVYADAGVRLVLAGEADLAVLEWPDRVDVLAVEDAADAGVAPLAAPVAVGPEQLAYVIYTSGSTGAPKGVMVSHRSAVNTVEDVNERFGVGADDRVLGISALDFDLSVYDIFGLLGAGGAVVLVGEGDRRDARCWAGLVRRWGVTVWNSVPSLLDMLLVAAGNAGPGGTLRLALVSGDWVGLDLPGRLASACQGCRLVALGGATEAAIWSNAFEVTGEVPGHWRSIPYGYPLGNQMFRVVDAWGRDCPDWVPGELWIGGEGVALGYWGDPERTSSRFISGDQRWYRTGDQGRYWPDGTLEFLGRADLQVKVRGHRIELGEIEAALQSHPGVARAVAIVTDGGGQRPGPPSAGAVRTGPGPQLAAVVVGHVPGADLELPALEQFLAGRLPGYMLPQQVVAVAELPLSANGKLDRKAVAGLLARADHAGVPPGLPPQGETEQAIAAIWTELLGLAAIDRDQSFFALGGDSLLATRLIETMHARFGTELSLRNLMEGPTLAQVGALVTAERGTANSDDTADLEEGVL